MIEQHIRKIILLMAAITSVYLFYMGAHIAPVIKSIGLFAYIDQQGWSAGVLVFSFSFAFPFALLCIVLAGMLTHKRNLRLIFLIIFIISALSTLMVLWPFVVGNENSRWYFMIGGGLLFILISTVAWFWAKQRNQVISQQRKIVDLRGMAYFCFALATWNICGAMGMPGYGLYAERSLEVNAYPFITGQVKVIMLYLIMAWFFLMLSYLFNRKQALLDSKSLHTSP